MCIRSLPAPPPPPPVPLPPGRGGGGPRCLVPQRPPRQVQEHVLQVRLFDLQTRQLHALLAEQRDQLQERPLHVAALQLNRRVVRPRELRVGQRRQAAAGLFRQGRGAE